MVKFYLVRHGETDWNLQGRFQGIENIPLNETGLAQAVRCGKGLKSCGIPFDCIVASPLNRARVTAETIAGFVGSVEVKVDERLIERDFGKVSGRKKEERETMLASGLDLQMEDESLVADRMQAVLEYYSNSEYKHVLLVSHGASIRALLGKYCEAGSVPTVAVQQNAYVTVIAYNGEKYYMEAYDVAPEDL